MVTGDLFESQAAYPHPVALKGAEPSGVAEPLSGGEQSEPVVGKAQPRRYSGNRAFDVNVVHAGHGQFVAQASLREGSRTVCRFVGSFCPSEQEAIASLEPLLARFHERELEKAP